MATDGVACCLYAEFRRSLSVLSIFFSMKRLMKTSQCSTVLTIENNRILLSGDDSSPLVIDVPSLNLAPASCRNLNYFPSGELHVRVHAERKANVIKEIPASMQSKIVDKITAYQNNCFCSSCGNKLLANHCHFQRVLPLPSDNWYEMSDFWFCHKHEGAESPLHNGLSIKQKDCLVGSLYVLLNATHMKMGAYTQDAQTGQVQCARCRTEVGLVYKRNYLKSKATELKPAEASELFQLYFHKISFCGSEGLESELSSGCLEESYFAHYLLEQSRMYTSYRFRVTVKSHDDQKKTEMLFWLFDSDTDLFLNALPVDNLNHQRREMQLNPLNATKVLYLFSFPGGRKTMDKVAQFSVWRKDQSVLDLDMSHTMCLSLASALVKNTARLPLSQRKMNGFHVGFLRTG